MTPKQQERVDLFKEAVRQNAVPSRILNLSATYAWKYLDAGFSLDTALLDYEKLYEGNMRFARLYPHDVHVELGSRFPLTVTGPLGNDTWVVTPEAVSIHDNCFMLDNEYDQLIADPKKYLWEVYMPRKNKFLRQENAQEVFRQGMDAYLQWASAMKRISSDVRRTYEVPPFLSSQALLQVYDQGHEFLFSVLRGIRKLAIDGRRQPQKVKEAIESIEHYTLDANFEKLYAMESGSDPGAQCDQMLSIMSHSILTVRQFEEYYWPFLKKLGDYAQAKDKIFYMFLESDSERFWDFFRELPKGHFLFHIEMDDIYKMKKACPNLAFAGGMPLELLGHGTRGECVEKAKELCRTVGADGGYVFSENKCISHRHDALAENLRAVCEFFNPPEA